MDNKIYKQNFAPRLKQSRKEMNNISQRDFAKLIGVSKSTIASYEIERTEPNLETLAKIAKITGHTIDYYLGQADD